MKDIDDKNYESHKMKRTAKDIEGKERKEKQEWFDLM